MTAGMPTGLDYTRKTGIFIQVIMLPHPHFVHKNILSEVRHKFQIKFSVWDPLEFPREPLNFTGMFQDDLSSTL